MVHHTVLDPRDGKTLLAAAHRPPRPRRLPLDRRRQHVEGGGEAAGVRAGQRARRRPHVLADAGHATQPGVWYAGTSPQGLFRSEDGGVTWSRWPASTIIRSARRGAAATRTGRPTAASSTRSSSIRAIRAPVHRHVGRRHLRVPRRRRRLDPLNHGVRADFLPDPDLEFGHDPHCVRCTGGTPTGCTSRTTAASTGSTGPRRAGPHRRRMPKRSATSASRSCSHPRDPDTAWVFPMDGTTVWPRVSPGGRPAVYLTRDAGKSWQRQADGMPKAQAWWTVKRQAMSADAFRPSACTSARRTARSGGPRRGPDVEAVAAHLPQIYAVEVGLTGRGGAHDCRCEHASTPCARADPYVTPESAIALSDPAALLHGRRGPRRVVVDGEPPRLADVFAALDAAYPDPLPDGRRVRAGAPAHPGIRRQRVERDPAAVLPQARRSCSSGASPAAER